MEGTIKNMFTITNLVKAAQAQNWLDKLGICQLIPISDRYPHLHRDLIYVP